MNNKLQELIKQLEQAYGRLCEVMQERKTEIVRDSAIQRFEFTFEVMWKTLKVYLEKQGVRVYTPRDTMREAFRAGLIDNDPKWLEMITTRNLTAHVYNEAKINEIYNILPTYVLLIARLVEKIKAGIGADQ